MTQKTTLIIGGSSGMGLATARALVLAGENVVITGRDAEMLSAAADSLGSQERAVQLDLGDRGAVEAFASEIAGRADAFDGLVNAAGVFAPKPFLENTAEDFDTYHEINRASFVLRRAVAERMAKAKKKARSSTSARCGRIRQSRRRHRRLAQWRKRAFML